MIWSTVGLETSSSKSWHFWNLVFHIFLSQYFMAKKELFLLWTSSSDNSSLWIHIWFNFCASSNFDWIWIQLRWSNLSGNSFQDDSGWSIFLAYQKVSWNVSANQVSRKLSWWDSQSFVIKIFDIHKLKNSISEFESFDSAENRGENKEKAPHTVTTNCRMTFTSRFESI